MNRRINFANTAVKEIFGWNPEELIGRSVTIFYRSEKESKEIARYFFTATDIDVHLSMSSTAGARMGRISCAGCGPHELEII